MKTKKHEKKLKLNKITIATLNWSEMRAAVGADGCPPPMATVEYLTCDKDFNTELKGESTFWC